MTKKKAPKIKEPNKPPVINDENTDKIASVPELLGLPVQKERIAKAPTPEPTGSPDFVQGFKYGFEQGLKIGKEIPYEPAFAHGTRHIVTLAEEFLTKELELTSRDALVKSGKIPAWWIATLLTALDER